MISTRPTIKSRKSFHLHKHTNKGPIQHVLAGIWLESLKLAAGSERSGIEVAGRAEPQELVGQHAHCPESWSVRVLMQAAVTHWPLLTTTDH